MKKSLLKEIVRTNRAKMSSKVTSLLALFGYLIIVISQTGCNTQAVPPTFFFPTNTVTIFSDDFESGNLNLWTASAPLLSPFTIDTTFNVWPVAEGRNSAKMDNAKDRMHHNLFADAGNKEVGGPAIVTFYYFDSGETNNAVQETLGNKMNFFLAGVMAHSGGRGIPNGGTTPDGVLNHSIGVGKIDGPSFLNGDTNGYQAGLYQVYISTPFRSGRLNLTNAHNRSVGWHRFDIERMEDGRTVNIYLDNTLGRTVQLPPMDTWDTVYMGAGLNRNEAGGMYVDGFSVSRMPDTNAPRPSIVHGSFTYDSVSVLFSEPVDESANLASRYTLTGGLTVLGVERISDTAVKLRTSPQVPGSSYTLTVANVQDYAGNAVTAPNNQAVFQAFTYSSFSSDFTAKPKDTILMGNAVIEEGILKLTPPVNDSAGSFKTKNFEGGKVRGFTATFRAFIGDGSGADGLSVGFGPVPDNTAIRADGIYQNPSLSIWNDTYMNLHQNTPEVFFRVNNSGNNRVPAVTRLGKWVDVYFHVDPDGTVDYAYNGTPVFTNLSAYTNITVGRLVFGASTGGANDKHWIDDLHITHIPEFKDATAPTLTGASSTSRRITLVFSEPMSHLSGLDPSKYLIEPAVPFTGIQISEDFMTVTITTGSTLDPATKYRITVKDLTDRANIPNTIFPNPSSVEFMPAHQVPAEMGLTVNGFQDDFRSSTLNSYWVPHGPAGNVYLPDPSRGVLMVAGTESEPNHLLYEAPGYDPALQEVLMLAWVQRKGAEGRHGGAAVSTGGTASPSENLGLNLHFHTSQELGNDLILQDDWNTTGGPLPNIYWTEKTPYWIRISYDGSQLQSKVWLADGDQPEPSAWDVLPIQNYSGFAGIAAPYTNPDAQLEIDYILIKAAGLPEINVRPEAVFGMVDTPRVTLTIEKNAEGLVRVSWAAEGILQEAADVRGPFQDVPDAPVSPYTVIDATGSKFFRLRLPD